MSQSSATSHTTTGVATSKLSLVALGLGVLGVIGSMFAWDVLPGGGFVWGAPVDVAAIVVGVTAVRQGAPSRGAAIAGVVLGAAMLLMMLIWTIAG